MKKVLIGGMSGGIALMTLSVPNIRDLIISIIQKKLNIEVITMNPIFSAIMGLLLFCICLKFYKNNYSKERIIFLHGLGNNEYWEKSNKKVEIINVQKWIGSNRKNAILNEAIKQTKKIIEKYLSVDLSFNSIAPIPVVSAVGTCFYKIKIKNYYEYNDSKSYMKKLNYWFIFPKLKLDIKNRKSNKNYAVISVGTTAKIEEYQLNQFKNCMHYKNTIGKHHQNSIFSRIQLNNYSNKIIEQINEVSSKKNIKRIYIVMATQTSLAFEIGKQINERIAKEVVVCHYQNDEKVAYRYGIIITGKNKYKCIELGDDAN